MLGLMMWLASIAMVDPPPDGCEIEVVGMPVSVMPHHRLGVGTEQERPLASRMPIQLGEGSARLRVIGPRYRGERVVSAQECGPGAVVQLEVEPLPARIDFPCAPDGLTIACTNCADEVGARVYLPEDFPPLLMSSFSREVELLLRAPGFRRETRTVQLHPGPNRVHVQLRPLAR